METVGVEQSAWLGKSTEVQPDDSIADANKVQGRHENSKTNPTSG